MASMRSMALQIQALSNKKMKGSCGRFPSAVVSENLETVFCLRGSAVV